jgi:acyl transferase domain-containing protein/NADP-dependent 3-hydroxy acid dehydrogenase YdfG
MSKKEDKFPEFVPLAIVGVGGVFPKAKSLREYWANIKNKVDAIQDVPASHWSKDAYFDADPKAADMVYAYKGGFLETYDFDPSEFGLSPNTLEATDPAQLFGLVAAKMALADAGYPIDKDTWDRTRVSTILGVTGALEIVIPLGARLMHPQWRKALEDAGVPKEQADDAIARISDGFVPWQEASFPGLLGNVVAGRIANRFNLGGTNCVVDAACGSSLAALHMASLELSARRATMVITGGVDTFNDIFMYTCFTKTPALSPSGHAKSFDAKADGTTLGEGVGMVVLKRLDDAQKDGDTVHAIIRGIGSSSDGRGKSIYAPSAEGQTRALKEAYRVSGIRPATIELVEAHGTGTAVGDGIEVEALAAVYQEAGLQDVDENTKRDSAWCALGSVKSMIGHTKAAAGSASLVKATMALRHKVFPPTLKVTEPHPVLAGGQTPFYLSMEKRPWMSPAGHPRRAAVSALGFGGTNFHAVLEESNSIKTETDWEDQEIVALSGNSVSEISAKLAPWTAAKPWDQVRIDAVACRKSFDVNALVRMALVLEKGSDYVAVAKKSVSLLSSNAGKSSWSSPEGIYFGSGKPGKLGVLFPGQGAQYVGMSRDLVCAFPESFGALAEADASFEGMRRLSDHIFPQPAWKPEQAEAQEKSLRATEVAQPALGAGALAAWRALARFGVKADAAAGHSYGELVALHLAGRFDAETLHALSRLRGCLMAKNDGDKGSMLAVAASLSDVEKAVAEEKLDLVVANRNTPTQNVLSGSTGEIERAEKVLSARGLKAVRLPVSAAFHSALVAPALAPFTAALNKIAFAKAALPVYANTTGEVYPEEAKKALALLANQLAKPVEFVKLVERMHSDGVRTFLEVGPGARLTGLAGQILRDKDFTALAVDSSNGKRNGVADLARALAQLAALGYALDLTGWQGGEEGLKDCRPKPKMSVPLTGATYRSTPKKNFPKKEYASPAAMPVSPAAAPTADTGLLGQALSAAQASIDAMTKLQEQTAALHLQFLQGQDSAQRSVQALVEQQQALYARLSGGVPMATPAFVPAPAQVPVPAPAAVVIAAPVTAPAPELPNHDVLSTLTAVVAEKTGYPVSTINPDMDLEGDLGIDSIKRVEILSAVSEKLPGAPKVKPEHLGTLRTLKLIAAYLSSGMTQTPAPAAAPALAAGSEPILPVLLSIVAEKTGYPADTLNPDMDLEGDLGIDSIKRVEILSAVAERLPGAPKVKPEHLGTLRTLKQIASYLSAGMTSAPPAPAPVVPAPAAAKAVEESCAIARLVPEMIPLAPRDAFPLEKGATIAVTRDSGLDAAIVRELASKGFKAEVVSMDDGALPADCGALVVVAPARPAAKGCPWTAESEAWLKKAFRLVQAAGRSFQERGVRGRVMTITRLDGALGFSGGKDQDPIFGGLAGLMKTAAREWPGVVCRAVDVDPALGPDVAAPLLVKEMGFDGPVEGGLSDAGLKAVGLVERAPQPGREPLKPGDAVIVTGGARGVTAACALALAEAFKPCLVLVGRSPLPGAEAAEYASAKTEAELRSAIAKAEKSLAPKAIGEKAKGILAAREIRETLASLTAAGAEARYRAVDARQPAAVEALVAETVRDFGPIRGLVHGAGVLADKAILDKTAAQLDAVLDTKLSGLRNFLDALALSDLRLLAFFSSSTARYGRVGQSDYALANEAMNKAAQVLAARLPSCRVASLGWGPWDGGMVDAGLKKLFAAEGVGVIGLRAGGDHFIAETRSSGPAETVVLASLPGAKAALPVVFERDLTLQAYPFLESHVLNGRAVLPLAISAEWLAHAALHANPGLVFVGFDDLRSTKGVLVARDASTTVKVHAGAAQKQDGLFAVAAELRGAGGAVHASAKILLAAKRSSAPAPTLRVSGPAYARTMDEAYREVLFHGPDMRFLLSAPVCGPEGIVVESKTALPPASWVRQPMRDRWLSDPAAMDAAFQAMILWTEAAMGAPSLPSYAVRYRQYAERFPEGGVRIVAKAAARAQGLAGADIEFLDERGGLVAKLEGFECAVDASLSAAFRRNVMEEGAVVVN